MRKEYTVEAWAREWFRRGADRWNPRTEGGYRNLIERHIVPGVGQVKLEALKPVHINRLYAELAEKGLSAKSVWCVHLLLRRILDAACKDGLLDVNPADFCKAPDAAKKPPVPAPAEPTQALSGHGGERRRSARHLHRTHRRPAAM